ncbi:MAG: N-acetylmuramoyl-L-alanine amidase family protein [Vicinamibacteria bacterium]
MKICVDAGHGGADPGAIGLEPSRLEEKDVTLAVAFLLEEELALRGHEIVMPRRQDRTLASLPRAEFANRFEADLFLSLHANAAASPRVEGMEVFHFPGSRAGREASASILNHMLAAFPGHENRGVKEADFTVLRETAMPAVLVEMEFLTNPAQLRFLADPKNQRGLARAIAEGVPGGAVQEVIFA